MSNEAETFAKYHDEHAAYGCVSQEFHERAASFLRFQAERIVDLEAKVVLLEGCAALDDVRIDAVKVIHGQRIAELEAENARLRERERIAYDSRNAAQERANDAERENARLRGEVEKLEAVSKRIMRQDATFLANERAEGDRLRLDLAHVTAERDGLLAAGRDVLTSETITPPRSSDAIVLKKWAALIAACAAPAGACPDCGRTDSHLCTVDSQVAPPAKEP